MHSSTNTRYWIQGIIAVRTVWRHSGHHKQSLHWDYNGKSVEWEVCGTIKPPGEEPLSALSRWVEAWEDVSVYLLTHP